jgi:hypothetical protein
VLDVKRVFLVIVNVAFLSSAASQTSPQPQMITVPSTGAMFCQDSNDISRLVLKQTPLKSCGVIQPGKMILSLNMKEEAGIKGGIGIADGINEGKPFTFIMTEEVAGPTKSSTKKTFSDARQFKAVSPSDVRNTPGKWVGRDIEFSNVNVYWVSDDDVRFITKTSLTIFAESVQGEDVDFLRKNCETEKEAFSGQCRVNVRFSYQTHSEDSPTGIAKRTVIMTDDVMVFRVKGRRR